MSFDPVAFRREGAESWAGRPVWVGANRAVFQTAVAPVSVDARGGRAPAWPARSACSIGRPDPRTRADGRRAHPPGGTLICTDVAEEMLDAARARAAELGLEGRRVQDPGRGVD